MKMYKKGILILVGVGERCANRIVLVVAVAMESLEYTALRWGFHCKGERFALSERFYWLRSDGGVR